MLYNVMLLTVDRWAAWGDDVDTALELVADASLTEAEAQQLREEAAQTLSLWEKVTCL